MNTATSFSVGSMYYVGSCHNDLVIPMACNRTDHEMNIISSWVLLINCTSCNEPLLYAMLGLSCFSCQCSGNYCPYEHTATMKPCQRDG